MLDKLEERQLHGLIAGIVIIAVIAFVAGSFLGGGLTDAFGNGDEGNGVGEEVPESEIEESAQSFMDMQLQQTQQQLLAMAEQNENISEDDVYIESSVDEVSSSEFGSLYKVTFSITGEFPAQDNMGQPTGEFEEIDEEQDLFVSQDGRYVFQQPTDLEQQSSENMQQPSQ